VTPRAPERGQTVGVDPIDLNADLGEGFGRWTLTDDDALLSVVTSANVACGFHAGDPSTMRRVCERAVEAGVRIGAQVSYRDLAGFGRRTMDVPPDELADEVTYQIGALAAFAAAAGDRVRYVKPHGALYNRVVADEDQAAAVVAGVVRAGGDLPILALPGSAVLACAAEAGLTTVTEGFVDRAYEPDGTLVSRRRPGAVLDGEATIVGQALRLARSGEVVAVNGDVVAVRPRSLCLHGDTPGAAALAAAIRRALSDAGAAIAPFA
jgi:UPF0271 protein